MNKNNILVMTGLLSLWLLYLVAPSYAQIVGTNAFMQGSFVELGINRCGVYGANAAPPLGYHPNVPAQFGFVADSPKNGWGTAGPGALPNFCGDYFTPGTPEEGWGIQANGASYINTNTACNTGLGVTAGPIPGGILSHTMAPGIITVVWEGTTAVGAAAGLRVRQTTNVYIDSLYIVTIVDITNTTTAPMNNLFYARNVDPDNDVQWPGGSFNTTNTVVDRPSGTGDQNALVRAVSNLGCFLGLGARDCRSRASFGCFTTQAPIEGYFNSVAHTCSPTRSVIEGASLFCDCGIGLGFSLGTIEPGEKISISYAYVLADEDLPVALGALGFRFGPDQIICKGTGSISFPFTLNAPDGYESYLWSDGSTGKSIVVNGPGLYWGEGTVFIPGTVPPVPCTQRDSIILTELDPFKLNVGKSTEPVMDTRYIGDSAVYTPLGFRAVVSSGYVVSDTIYRWYRQDAYPFAPFAFGDSVAFTSPGEYILQVEMFPCTVFDTIRVTSPIPIGFEDPYIPVLVGEPGSEKVYLSWNAAKPEQGIAAYDVYGYDSLTQLLKAGRTKEANFTVSGLLNGRNYTFILRPVLADLNGEVSYEYGTSSNLVTVRPSIILGENTDERISIKLFPNPSQGVFNIKADGTAALFKSLQVLNTLGQVVYQQDLKKVKNAFETNIKLDNVPNGIYLVRVETSKGVYQQKTQIIR